MENTSKGLLYIHVKRRLILESDQLLQYTSVGTYEELHNRYQERRNLR